MNNKAVFYSPKRCEELASYSDCGKWGKMSREVGIVEGKKTSGFKFKHLTL